MSDNMRIYDQLRRPPEGALRTIKGGRLAGKSDINPQWRVEAMTEAFGPVGVGWRYEINRLWLEQTGTTDITAFALVTVYWRDPATTEWSAGVPGVGGNMLTQTEKTGLHVSDEAYKMAVTDAIGTALRMLGVAGDIYAGRFDGSKYTTPDVPFGPLTATAADFDRIRAAREAAGLSQAAVSAILRGEPFCVVHPRDLLQCHVETLLDRIAEVAAKTEDGAGTQ
jgi:hypothetical protein